jgi:hypothetical protein
MTADRDEAMRRAVELAQTGDYADWDAIAKRLRAEGYQPADLGWTQAQRNWLDQVCAEAQGR